MPAVTVFESNALGDPVSGLADLWRARQSAEQARQAAQQQQQQALTTPLAVASALPVTAVSTVEMVLAGGGASAGALVDGVCLAPGDAVLLVAQTVSTENGVWVVAPTGGPSRSTPPPAAGSLFYAVGGATQAGCLFVCSRADAAAVTIRPVASRGLEALAVDVSAVAAAQAALQRPAPVAWITPPYAAAVTVPVTRDWLHRSNYFCPTGTAPVTSEQTLQLAVVLAEGEEVEVHNGSSVSLAIAGPPPGALGPAAGVAVWDDARTRAYALGGTVVGLGTRIVPGGAAIIKQLTSGGIADPATTPAVAVAVGALQP